jgi:hypothetical protein
MFNRIPLQCHCCGKVLLGGIDTWGEVGQEFCQDCYYEITEEYQPERESHYGLAPHHHDLTITGSIFGSTVLDALPSPDENGRFWIAGRKAWFTPDPEAPGLGFWDAPITSETTDGQE